MSAHYQTLLAEQLGARRARSIATGLLHYPGVRCPSCGGRAFAIGRVTAECTRCAGALLLTNSDPLKGDAK